MNKIVVIEKYWENFAMAIDDGHTEEASRIAWQWTEEYFQELFNRFKAQHEAEWQDSVNKIHFG